MSNRCSCGDSFHYAVCDSCGGCQYVASDSYGACTCYYDEESELNFHSEDYGPFYRDGPFIDDVDDEEEF